MRDNCGFCDDEVKTSTITSSTTSSGYLSPGVYVTSTKYHDCTKCGEILPSCKECLIKKMCIVCSRSEKIEECLS